MQLAITTENRIGMSKAIMDVLAARGIDIRQVEIETGKMYLRTQPVDAATESALAADLMKIDGVKWVQAIEVMPATERSLMLSSLLDAMPDPVLGINSNGRVIYRNRLARELFVQNGQMPRRISDVFASKDWKEKIDAAGSGELPVKINTVSGPMLVDVRAYRNNDGKVIGALLQFHRPERVLTRSHLMQGADVECFDDMVYASSATQDVVERARRMAEIDAPLLLQGEAGTGKSLLARACHNHSARKNHLFVELDCASTPDSQLLTQLFGGDSESEGLVALARGGTILLKAIDRCSLPVQKTIHQRLATQGAPVRLMATTSGNLKARVNNGSFLPDLHYALDVLSLTVPPLRQRREDIEPLALHFLGQFREQLGKPGLKFSFAALNRIRDYYWPGNVRQLKSVLHNATLLAANDLIQSSDFGLDEPIATEVDYDHISLPKAVEEFEKNFLKHWYQKHQSTRKLAARLGVSHTTIAQKLNKYGINKKTR
jgi:transcriptional regulator of aroF, aroG, tyrA and aromatic amino acid transport